MCKSAHMDESRGKSSDLMLLSANSEHGVRQRYAQQLEQVLALQQQIEAMRQSSGVLQSAASLTGELSADELAHRLPQLVSARLGAFHTTISRAAKEAGRIREHLADLRTGASELLDELAAGKRAFDNTINTAMEQMRRYQLAVANSKFTAACELRTKLELALTRSSEFEKNLIAERARLVEAAEKNTDLQAQLQRQTAECADLKKQIAEVKCAFQQQLQFQKDAETKASLAEEKGAKRQEEILKLREVVLKDEKIIALLKKQIGQLEVEVQEKNKQLIARRQYIEDLQNDIGQLVTCAQPAPAVQPKPQQPQDRRLTFGVPRK